MTSKPVALLRAALGVTQSRSRPQVSNDNPYSEAQFKTLKYRPDFPTRFGALDDARAHCVDFVRWYNTEQYHSGLALHTPYDIHHDLATARNTARATVLAAVCTAHPERFVRRPPTPRALPTAAWIWFLASVPRRIGSSPRTRRTGGDTGVELRAICHQATLPTYSRKPRKPRISCSSGSVLSDSAAQRRSDSRTQRLND